MDSGDSVTSAQLNNHSHYFAFRDDGEEDRSSAVLRQSRADARSAGRQSLNEQDGLEDEDEDGDGSSGLPADDNSGCPACCHCGVVLRQPLVLRASAQWSGCQRVVLRHHRVVLVSFVSLSFLLLAVMAHFNSFAAYTALSPSPSPFTCHDVLWIDGAGCGLMGRDCLPFTSSSPLTVRCAARCDYFPYYQQRLTGSAPYYRADSYVCTAAIHAGVIGSGGGCVSVLFTGGRSLYNETTAYGLRSRASDTWFPKSFTLLPAEGGAHCVYFHWWTLAVGLLLLSGLCLLQPPPALLFLCLLLWGYWYTASSMDDGHTQEEVFFIMTERICYVTAAACPMFFLGPRVTLTARNKSRQRREDEPEQDDEQPQQPLSASEPQPPSAGLSRSSLSLSSLWRPCLRWLQAYDGAAFTLHLPSARPAAWYELCCLYTLPFVLGLHWGYLTLVVPDVDLNAQFLQHGNAGVVLVLGVGAVVLLLVLLQLRLVYAAGLSRRYLLGYGCLAAVFVVVSVVWRRGYSFHLHHVLIGAVLLPLTRFRTRVSMLCQAIALALFINGFALWGFASEWDHTGGDEQGDDDPIDLTPPRSVLAVNVSESSALLLWEWRNDSGSAIGSIGFLNDIILAFKGSWQDTRRWRNDSVKAGDLDLWSAAAAAVPLHLPPAAEPGLFTFTDGHTRHYSTQAAARLGVVGGVPSAALLGVRPEAEAEYEARLSAQLSDDKIRDFAVLRLDGLLANLSYFLSVCYVFTYGVIGPCTYPILIDTRLRINASQLLLPV